MQMEFWGLEIKPEETVKVHPGENKYLRVTQASLGETKKDKGNENIFIYVKVNNQKLVLGTLSAEKCLQIQYDLVFEKGFELSHSSKNASVHLCGYKTVAFEEDEFPDFDESDSDDDEDIQLVQKNNGKPIVKEKGKSTAGKPNALKADASAAKAKPKVEELKKADKQKAKDDDEDDDDKDSDDDDDESDEDESDDDEDMAEAEDDSENEDESSDEEDEATAKKAEPFNKRPAASALKTPVPEKKAKISSGPGDSQKKGGAGKRVGTPHPAKQSGKAPASNDKSKQQTPKSTGSVGCKTCGKTFNSDNALQAHTKAKHSAAK